MPDKITTRKILKKEQGRIPSNMKNYFVEAGEEDLLSSFHTQHETMRDLLESIDEQKSVHKYGSDKWTIKEVLQHLVDAERVFAYRALAIARHDEATLPSFDENLYANMSGADEREWVDIVEEFYSVRKATVTLFNSFSEQAMDMVGNVSDYSIGVTTLGYVIVGHARHHVTILKERYLK